MDFMKFLTDQLSNPETLRTMGQNVQAKPAQVKQITELGIPALLQAINRNASTQQGANSLLKALEQHQDDKVDDIPNFLNQIDRNDANKMLQHILGGKKKK